MGMRGPRWAGGVSVALPEERCVEVVADEDVALGSISALRAGPAGGERRRKAPASPGRPILVLQREWCPADLVPALLRYVLAGLPAGRIGFGSQLDEALIRAR